MGYFNYLGTCALCMEKLPNLRDSNRKNSKSFLGVSVGTRISCLMRKTGDEISRDTVP